MNEEKANSLEATVDRWEGDLVVLRTSDGQELLWPSDRLPSDVVEGSVVSLVLMTDQDTTDERRDLARNILNEIFDTNSGEEK